MTLPEPIAHSNVMPKGAHLRIYAEFRDINGALTDPTSNIATINVYDILLVLVEGPAGMTRLSAGTYEYYSPTSAKPKGQYTWELSAIFAGGITTVRRGVM